MKADTYLPIIPQKLSADLIDEFLDSMSAAADMQIHCIITLNERIDAQRLEKAAWLSLDVEPILGFYFSPGILRSVWRRCALPSKDRILEVIEAEDADDAVKRCLLEKMSRHNGPRVKIFIVRSVGDRIVIKLDHRVGDGAGLQEYAYLLASLYNRLSEKNTYRPEMRFKPRMTFNQIIKRFSLQEKLKIIKAGIKVTRAWNRPKPIWRFEITGDIPAFESRKIVGREFRSLKTFCRQHKISLNDLIAAAVYRAFYELSPPPPRAHLRLVTTVNCRRYLPADQSIEIANLSGYGKLNIGRNIGSNMMETIAAVKNQMNWLKSHYIGLDDYLFAKPVIGWLPALLKRFIAKRHIKSSFKHHVPMGMTNVGSLSPEKLVFTNVKVKDAFISPILLNPPGFLVCATGFKDSLTFSIPYFGSENGNSDIQKFFDQLIINLTSVPSQNEGT